MLLEQSQVSDYFDSLRAERLANDPASFIAPKLRPLFDPYRYKIIRGGRGGMKSWTVAMILLMKGWRRPLRVLCGREFQASIAESVHKLLSDQIQYLGLEKFYAIEKKTIRGPNGTSFFFEGLKSNVRKIKSYEGVDIVWVEEAQMVSKDSWEILIPTIRRRGSEIWLTFNPDLEEDETWQRFVVDPPPNSLSIEVNYNENPWLPDELRKEMEYLKRKDLEAYENIWLGKCRKQVRGALWTKELISAYRVPFWQSEEERIALRDRMTRVVIAVDPSGCEGPEDERSDKIGITADAAGFDHHGYVIGDYTDSMSPLEWARKAIWAYDYWQADEIVAEDNFGGAMVEQNIRAVNANVPVRRVRASRGKVKRATPVAALYEKGWVHHVGHFPELERQMCLFDKSNEYKGKRSPDNADANIWGLTSVMLESPDHAIYEVWAEDAKKIPEKRVDTSAHVEVPVTIPIEEQHAAAKEDIPWFEDQPSREDKRKLPDTPVCNACGSTSLRIYQDIWECLCGERGPLHG